MPYDLQLKKKQREVAALLSGEDVSGWFFATLQNTPFTMTGSVYDGLLQAVYILIAWVLLSRLRRVVVHEEKKTES